ncbi:MAG TPA: carboxypeptidase-like regulatory domain-containing protein [Kofleriaceae bacterium]|nr:carboxypeptidase-like regulatory domain-containing protein [Kofleriaceae bacterium]
MIRGVRPIAPFLLATIAVWALAHAALAAPPQVEIRAQTKLVLDRVQLLEGNIADLRGHLLDALTGDGIEKQRIEIQIGEARRSVVTSPDGQFHAEIEVESGPQPIKLSFGGATRLEPANLSQLTDPARAQVVLTIDFEDAPGGAQIMVRATSDDQPVTIPVALAAGPPTEGRLAPVGRVQTGTPFLLTRKAVGGPGTRRVRATFTGDDVRQPATAEKTVDLSASSTTTLALTATRLAFEDDLGVSGNVTDEDGHPVGHAAVTLASSDRRLAQGATDDNGAFRFRIEGKILGEGQWGLQVQADPGTPSIRSSRSPPEIVRVSAPQPVPVSYTIAAFVATACAAGGFFMARARPWNRLRRPAPPAEAPASATQEDELTGGLVVARPGLVSTLRRASDDGFSGAVRDTVRGRPVADAVVWLRLHDAERCVRTGPDGNFTFEALAMGEWLAEVTASGHVTEKFVVSIPHRGELRGVRVDLVPVRERVFQLYRRAAEPILPEPRLWGVWSPRQIVDHVRSKRPTPALADLTSFVEEIYFSARLAEETVLPAASEHVDRAIRERARAAS